MYCQTYITCLLSKHSSNLTTIRRVKASKQVDIRKEVLSSRGEAAFAFAFVETLLAVAKLEDDIVTMAIIRSTVKVTFVLRGFFV